MLPLLAVGAGLLMAGKVASDMNEAKKYSDMAREEAEDGNYYLKKAAQYRNEIEENIKEAIDIVSSAKEVGVTYLFNNFSYFSDIDLENKKFKEYKKVIEDYINNYGLSITIDEVIESNNEIKNMASQLGIDLKNIKVNNKNLVDDVAIETIGALGAHGIMAVGIGGAAALAGAEFLMATGIGALVLAPFVLSVSGDKVDEAKSAYYKASQFKEEARVEMEKWKGQLEYIYLFKEVSDFYHDFILNTVDVSNYLLEKHISNPNDLVVIIKNIITLAYLSKFIQYQYIDEYEMGDLNQLISWVKYNAEEEAEKFQNLKDEIKKIKES